MIITLSRNEIVPYIASTSQQPRKPKHKVKTFIVPILCIYRDWQRHRYVGHFLSYARLWLMGLTWGLPKARQSLRVHFRWAETWAAPSTSRTGQVACLNWTAGCKLQDYFPSKGLAVHTGRLALSWAPLFGREEARTIGDPFGITYFIHAWVVHCVLVCAYWRARVRASVCVCARARASARACTYVCLCMHACIDAYVTQQLGSPNS